MTVGHDAITPADVTLISEPTAKHPKYLPQEKAAQSQGSADGEDHVQEEVLEWRYLVHSRAQVDCTVVTEDVVDPVHSPAHRVARLVFVNVGEESSLLAVPVYGATLLLRNDILKWQIQLQKLHYGIIHAFETSPIYSNQTFEYILKKSPRPSFEEAPLDGSDKHSRALKRWCYSAYRLSEMTLLSAV